MNMVIRMSLKAEKDRTASRVPAVHATDALVNAIDLLSLQSIMFKIIDCFHPEETRNNISSMEFKTT